MALHRRTATQAIGSEGPTTQSTEICHRVDQAQRADQIVEARLDNGYGSQGIACTCPSRIGKVMSNAPVDPLGQHSHTSVWIGPASP
jgi:hypothetical protein